MDGFSPPPLPWPSNSFNGAQRIEALFFSLQRRKRRGNPLTLAKSLHLSLSLS